MKKILGIALVGLVSVSTSYAYTSAQLDAANSLAAQWIINDKSANVLDYNLDQNVLRQEIAAVARWVAGVSKTTTCDNRFNDVWATTPNTWACYSIEALLNENLIAANASFRPEDTITKAEGLGMLVKAACADYNYDANKAGSWQEQLVDYSVQQGIVTNFTDYNSAATRGWVFEAGDMSMKNCGWSEADDQEAFDILEELLEDL